MTLPTLRGERLGGLLALGLSWLGLPALAQNPCSLPTPAIVTNSPLCEGSNLVFGASNVANGATYHWTGPNGFSVTRPNPRIPNATPANAGWYYLTVSLNGCTATDSTLVTINPLPAVSITPGGSTTLCQGDSLTLTASGASTYVWSTGQNGASIRVGATGNYSVTGFAANGCSAVAGPLAVTVRPAPTVSVSASGPLSFCQGGAVTLTANAAPAGTTLLWSTGATGASIQATTSGTYTVTATRNGCAVTSAPVVVTVSPLPTVALSATGSTTFCPGDSVLLSASGSPGVTYQFLLNGQPITGTTGAGYVARQAGTYTVRATTAAGCTATSSGVTVTVRPAPTISVSAGGPTAFCQGGTVTLTATASPGANIIWNTGHVGPQLVVTSSGTYSATAHIPNTNTCTATSAPITVTVSPAPTVSVTASGPTTLCAGDPLTLTATASAGATYLWQPGGATTASLPVTASGSYSVTVTQNGCSTTSPPTVVTVNPRPAAPLTTAAQRCGPGSLTLAASGAPTGGTYHWYAALTGGSPLPGAQANTFTTPSLSASTTYYVAAVSSAGCEGPRAAVQATITALPTVTVAATGATTFCQGDSVTLTASGAPAGATYLWNTGATTASITATTSGSYSVTVTSTAGCTVTSAATTVTVTPLPTVSVAATGPTTFCQGGSVTLTASGAAGATYLWSTGATTPSIPVSTAGTYTVTATRNGCTTTSAPLTVVVQPLPTATLTASGPTTFCAGDSVRLTAPAGPGLSYQFKRNGQAITGATAAALTVTQAGSYEVVVTAATGCAATSAPVPVTVNPRAVADFAYATSTYCLSAPNPTPVVTGNAGGTFSATPSGLSLDPATGLLNLAASAAGTYVVSYQVSSTCPATKSQVITLTTAPVATFTFAVPSVCAGSPAPLRPILGAGASAGTFSASPVGLALSATDGIIDPVTSQPGTYTVTNTIAAGGTCAAATSSATLTVLAPPSVGVVANGPLTFCAGDSVQLTASGASAYQWSTGATTASIVVRTSGTYSVVGTNSAGCAAPVAQAITVTVNPVPSAAFAYASSTFCLGGGPNPTTTITGQGGGTFTAVPGGLSLDAATGAIDLSASAAGTYTVTYAVGGSCPALQSQTLTLTTAPAATFAYATAGPVCAGSTAPVQITLAPGATTGTFSATPAGLNLDPATGQVLPATSQPGTYTISNSVAASGGCAATTATTTLTVVPAPAVAISASRTTTFCQGDSVVLTASGGAGYVWSTGATTAAITVRSSGTYSVTATSAAGCQATTAPLTVTVEPTPATPVLSSTPQAGGVLLTSSGGAGTQFFLNGAPISGATGATYLVTAPGTSGPYTAVVTSSGGCSSAFSAPVMVTTPLGLAGGSGVLSLQVYPNPTPHGEQPLVTVTGARGPVRLTVSDNLGRTVAQLTYDPARGGGSLPNLSAGVYTVRAESAQGARRCRLVVE